MGVTKRTIEQIRNDFNFSEDVKIIPTKDLSAQNAPSGFTCITVGQLEAGLKIPLYHPERPLQYEVLSELSRAPGQMNGNFFRIVNDFEDYNKEHPDRKISAKEFLELYNVVHSSAHPNCFYISKKQSVVLPISKVHYVSFDKDWPKFPILISGNWIHHPDLAPPPEICFDPVIWSLDEDISTSVKEETSSDESEKSTSPNNSYSFESDIKKPKSNFKSSINSVEEPHSHPTSKKTQQSTAEKSPPLHSLKDNIAIVLSSDEEETSEDEDLQVLKRPRKVSEAPMDNVSGPWFEELEGESEFQRTGGWEGLIIYIGNFPVQEKYAALYRQIWKRHGHLATRNVIKTSTCILVVAVTELLESITVMATVKFAEVDSSLLDKWDGRIADAEELKFNVGWLRKHFDEMRKTLDATSSLSNTQTAHGKALNFALQTQLTLCAKRDALKVQLAEVEQKLGQVTLEVIQHEQAVSEDTTAAKRYMSFYEKTFLHDAV